MKYLNLTKNIALIAVVSLVFMACKKAKVATPMGDAGQTLVKILGGDVQAAPSQFQKPIDFLPTPTRIVAVEIRRDVPNNTELMKPMTVMVKDDTAAVSFFNRDTVSTNPDRTNPQKLFYIHMPPAWYTTDGATKVGGQGGTFTVNFQPGEFSKTIYVVVPDATVFNPSAKYALGFTILSADGNAKLSTQTSAIVVIGAKNAYDGIYSVVSGYVQRYSGPGSPTTGDALNGPLGSQNPDVTMSTVGAYTVEITGLTWSPGLSGIAGIDNLRATVNPATNAVTMQSLGNNTLVNWTGFSAGPWNVYDPATRTFRLAFRWVTTSPPAYREYEIVLKYKGPR